MNHGRSTRTVAMAPSTCSTVAERGGAGTSTTTRYSKVDWASLPAVADADLLRAELGHRFAPEDLSQCLQGLVTLDILRDAGQPDRPLSIQKVEDVPLSTIILNVNTGCNLACTYCYKEDLTTPAKGERMDFATARSAIELLLAQAAAAPQENHDGKAKTCQHTEQAYGIEVILVPAGKKCGLKADFDLPRPA